MKEETIIGILIIALILMIVAVVFIIHRYFEMQNKKNQEIIFISGAGTSTRWRHALYLFLNDFLPVKYFIGRIRKRYEILEPGQKKKIEDDTIQTFGLIFAISILVCIISFFISVSLYMVISCISLIYVVSSTIIYYRVENKEQLLHEQLKEFLAEVRHNYYATNSVDESIYESLVSANEPIKSHMSKIHEILNSKTMDEDVAVYKDNAPNRYIELFLANCVQTIRYDDKLIKGQSCFLKNLTRLEGDIDTELLRRRDIKHRMMSLTYIAVIPMYCLNLIEKWAGSNMEELAHYYTGGYGIICSALICIVSMVIYTMLNQMKECDDHYSTDHVILQWFVERRILYKIIRKNITRNYGKKLRTEKLLHRIGESLTVEQFYVKKMLFAGAALLIGLFMSAIIHVNTKEFILSDTSAFDSLAITIPNNKQLEKIKGYIIDTTFVLKNEKGLDMTGVKEFVASQGILEKDVYINIATNEIYLRLQKYQNDYFRFWELFLIIGFMGIMYQLPVWIIYYRKRMLEQKMENEIILYQSIILIMMYHERVISRDILESMESFSYIFRSSIVECLNNFPSGEKDALEQLKEAEPYPPFCKLVDNLIATDRVGVRMAFSEVEGEREVFQEKRRQDDRINTENKGALGGFLAFIPLGMVTLLYIIVPIVLESLNMFSNFTISMSSMM